MKEIINNEIILQIISKNLKKDRVSINLLKSISYKLLYYIIANQLSIYYDGVIYIELDDILKFLEQCGYNFDKEFIFLNKKINYDSKLEVIIKKFMKEEYV